MTWETLLRHEVDPDTYYPPRCGNDKCDKNGRHYYEFVPAGDTEGNGWRDAYCSLKCFVEAAR